MNVNNIMGNYNGYFNNISMRNLSANGQVKKDLQNKDSIYNLKQERNLSQTNAIGGITIDKGTAAHTTVYVDKNSFNEIVNYSTNNSACKWQELGIDDEKRWVVINGQRFECPLSEEEKEMRRKLRRTFIDILNEAEKGRKKHKPKLSTHGSVKVSLSEFNKIKLDCNGELQSDNKIKNLLKNDKVMNMLSDIMRINGGKAINLSL